MEKSNGNENPFYTKGNLNNQVSNKNISNRQNNTQSSSRAYNINPLILNALKILQSRIDGCKEINESPITDGGFSFIFKVEVIKKLFALKIMKINENHTEIINKQYINEIRFLSLIKHPNFPNLYVYGQLLEKNVSYLMTEFCIYHDLNVLNVKLKHKKMFDKMLCYPDFLTNLSESLIQFFLIQIVSALTFLYNNRLVHQDIKPENIFLTDQCTIKLGDLALMDHVSQKKEFNFAKEIGTFQFRAPEIDKNEKVSKDQVFKSDYFALGVTLHKLCYGCYVGQNELQKQKDPKFKEKVYREIEKNGNYFHEGEYAKRRQISPEFDDLLRNLLKVDYRERADLDNIKNSKFYNKNLNRIHTINSIYRPEYYKKLILELEKIDHYSLEEDEDDEEVVFVYSEQELINEEKNDFEKLKNNSEQRTSISTMHTENQFIGSLTPSSMFID